jgi:hypothetical protein
MGNKDSGDAVGAGCFAKYYPAIEYNHYFGSDYAFTPASEGV